MRTGPTFVVTVAAELSSVSCLLPSALELAFLKSIMNSSWLQSLRRFRFNDRIEPPIPVEILSEIFMLVSHFPGDKRWNWSMLRLVCQHWNATILSTPGLHSQLRIRRATQKEVVEAVIQGRKTRLRVIVDMNDEGDGSYFNAENFRACFMAAIQAAPRWSSLNHISPPPHGEYKDLQILQPLIHLESLLACSFGELLEQLMAVISKDAFPNLTAMSLTGPTTILCLVQPAHSHIYHSLSTLKIHLFERMDSPVDILPHLHRLETLEACRLCLPSYSPDSPLPLIRTLRFLYLKSVSVQWIAGHVFPALEKCRIIFPHHAETLQASQPVTMPSCSFLLYDSNDLHPLTGFHLPSLGTLDVKNAQWNVGRGNLQLPSLYPIVSARPQTLIVLHLEIKCSGRLLVCLLELVPALQELWLELAHPGALGKTFFQAFIARELDVDGVSGMVRPPSQTIAPLCPSLKLLHLHYKRWMRGADVDVLVVALGDIVGSRQLETESSVLLRLSFDDAVEESHWTVGKPVREIQNFKDGNLILGISTQHAIVPISTSLPERGLASLPFKKLESLHMFADHSTSLELLYIRDHMELMVNDNNQGPLPSSLPHTLPLFYALRVLAMKCDNPSFLAGHTFHKLERCRLLTNRWSKDSPRWHKLTETEMPVCTRVDIDDAWVLATFRLPQLHELALNCSDPNCSVILEKHLSKNANLLGLTLLHMKNWPYDGDMTSILRSVPLLQTLIITPFISVDSFKAFLPMDANGTPGLKQKSGDGKTLAVLCPRLRHLRMENHSPRVRPDQLPFAKDIITLRAGCGSPLTVFTFIEFWREPGRKFELIGTDGSFTVEESAPAEGVEEFRLDI